MKPNLLVSCTAVIYALPGLALTFAADEATAGLGAAPSPWLSWFGQLLGAALLGLAFANWFQRFSAVGGIYGRPLLMTNLIFTMTSSFASLAAWRHHGGQVFAIAAITLGALAAAFGSRLFRPARA